jgi:hypothetical protein
MSSYRSETRTEQALTPSASSSEETSFSTFFAQGFKYLQKTTTRLFKQRRVRQIETVVTAVPNPAVMAIPDIAALDSTAYILKDLADLALNPFHHLRLQSGGNEEALYARAQARRHHEMMLEELEEEERMQEQEEEVVSLPQFKLKPKPRREEVLEEKLTEMPVLARRMTRPAALDRDFLSLIRALTILLMPSRPAPRPALVPQRQSSAPSLMPILTTASLLDHAVSSMEEAFFGAEQNSLLRLTSILALSLLMVDWAARNALAPHVSQPGFDAFMHPHTVLSRPQLRMHSPNPQQFFAPNYYRPAQAPQSRPVPPTPRNEQRLNAVNFPADLVPEDFTCALMATVMDNPVRLPVTKQVCDGVNILEAHARKPENPFNRQPMDKDGPNGPQPDLALRAKIGSYVDHVVEGVNNKKKELGGSALSRSDFEAVNQAALSRLEPQAQPVQAPRMGR